MLCEVVLVGALRAADLKPELSERIDYAETMEQLFDETLAEDLMKDRRALEGKLKAFRERCKERGDLKEADYKLAEKSYILCGQLLGWVDQWRERQEDLRRIQNDDGLLKVGKSSEREQQELKEKIQRKTRNLLNLWEEEVERARVGTAGRLLHKISQYQQKLDQYVDAGVVRLKGRQTTARPAPRPSPAPRPQPRPAAPRQEPEPEPLPKFEWTPPQVTVKEEGMKTPEHLLPAVKKTANWLEMQQRRVGGNLASRVFAQQLPDRVVLHLQVTELFEAQDRDTKKRFAEGVWHFWGMSCKQTRVVRSERAAYLVLMSSEGEVIGGSSETDASVIRVP